MTNFEQAAAAMFGASTPTGSPAPTPSHVPSTDERAERMFGQAPSPAPARNQVDRRPVVQLTEDELAQRLYGPTDPTLSHADATQAIINAGLEDHLHDPETAGEIAAEWASTFASHNLNATESKDLAELGAGALRSPPTPELVSQWTETAITNLQAEYGMAGAGQALQDARAYVASHPGLPDLLDAFGLGAHPKLVALAAARGRALRIAGKLR